MIELLRKALGLTEQESFCENGECLSESESRYIEAVDQAENGMKRANRMTQRSSDLPSWEDLMRERQRND